MNRVIPARFGNVTADPMNCTDGKLEVPVARPGLDIDINRGALH